MPLVFAGLWLLSSAAHYLRSNWHQYWGRHLLWVSGMGSIVIAAVLPLVLVLLVERGTVRLIPKTLVRGAAAAATALSITLFTHQPLAIWVGMSILRWGR